MRRRILAGLVVVGLAGAVAPSTAATTETPPCADITAGNDSYSWDAFTGTGTFALDVKLAGYDVDHGDGTTSYVSCSTTETAPFDYTLYVIEDHPAEIEAVALGLSSGALADGWKNDDELGSSEANEVFFDGNTSWVGWDVPIEDNDPTICVHVETSETVTTTTPNEPVDENGNGTTVDDQHKQNEGSNADGTKHDWGSTTTTSTIVHDVAPNNSGGTARCYFVTWPSDAPRPGAGARDYN